MQTTSINRRAAIQGMVLAGAGAGIAQALTNPAFIEPAPKTAPPLTVSVLLSEPIGTIKPTIYSQFAEHIGGVIYDGIWVGADSRIANVDGIRKTLIEHVKNLGPVVVRWPGGCFADRYHWRDGIGPRDRRPRRFGRWREETESNQFGTHEFLTFCRLTGTTPYLAANVGTGTAEEFQQWVEYCNAPAGSTSIADERAANGHREPYGIRYWGVGNESWGCGGKFTPDDYCREFRRFTDWLPEYKVPLYLIAAGPNGNDLDWTRRFMTKWVDGARAPLHGWAAHYYCGTTGHALEFSRDQWYEQLFNANRMESLIVDQWKVMGEFDPKHSIKLVVDEWGSWHPEGTGINPRHQFEQMGTLRDALVAALTLDIFNRHADKVDMTNVAQLVNNLHSLFLADGDQFVATPTYHVYTMYRPHQAATGVKVAINAPAVGFQAGGRPQTMFRLAGSASRTPEKRVTLTLVHTHANEPADVLIRLAGGSARQVTWSVLTDKTLNAHNTFAQPNAVVTRTADPTPARGGEIRHELPPASINRFDIDLA